MVKILQGIKAISGVIGFYSLKKEQRQVTFYSEGKNYWPHLQGLLKATLKKTGFSVCYISSSLEDPGLFMKHPKLNTFFIGMASVRDYFFRNWSILTRSPGQTDKTAQRSGSPRGAVPPGR